jgi:hypothetical protein
MVFETDGGNIAINPDRFYKLITALRTAVDNDGTLDKESTSYNDMFDAFRLVVLDIFYRTITKDRMLYLCRGAKIQRSKYCIMYNEIIKTK